MIGPQSTKGIEEESPSQSVSQIGLSAGAYTRGAHAPHVRAANGSMQRLADKKGVVDARLERD